PASSALRAHAPRAAARGAGSQRAHVRRRRTACAGLKAVGSRRPVQVLFKEESMRAWSPGRWRALLSSLGLAACALWAPALASAQDDAQTALNIIPSGQYGSIPPPPGAAEQAQMYDGLTPLFDHVTASDLTTYFKSERFGIDTSGPGTIENVPYVEASTYDGGIWAAGWIAAEDRGLLLQQARYNARVAAIDVPGLSALG